MRPTETNETGIAGSREDVVRRMVHFAERAASQAGQAEFHAEAFVIEWLHQPNEQLDGLPPEVFLVEIPGQGAVAGLLAKTLRLHLKLEGPL